jgi:hypothetical protein
MLYLRATALGSVGHGLVVAIFRLMVGRGGQNSCLGGGIWIKRSQRSIVTWLLHL